MAGPDLSEVAFHCLHSMFLSSLMPDLWPACWRITGGVIPPSLCGVETGLSSQRTS